MSLAILLVVPLLALAGLVAYYYYDRYKNLKKALGKAFTEVIEKGGDDGLLAFDIHDQDIDFKFIPTLQREKGFYYIKVKDGNGEEKKHHLKVKKKEIYYLRGRYPTIFLINDKIRAMDPEIIKTIDLMSPEDRVRLLADWSKWTSITKRIHEIEDELVFTRDETKRKALEQNLEDLRKQLEEIEDRWKLLFIELDANKALAYYDPEQNVVHIVKVIDFADYTDYMTGVYRDELEEGVRSLFNRKMEAFLKDLMRKSGMQVDQQQGGSSWSWLVPLLFLMALLGGGILFIGLIAKAFMGG